jgi:hypothetical protein
MLGFCVKFPKSRNRDFRSVSREIIGTNRELFGPMREAGFRVKSVRFPLFTPMARGAAKEVAQKRLDERRDARYQMSTAGVSYANHLKDSAVDTMRWFKKGT